MKKVFVTLFVTVAIMLTGCKAPWATDPAKAEAGYTEEVLVEEQNATAHITKVDNERANISLKFDQEKAQESLGEVGVTDMEVSFNFPIEKWNSVKSAMERGDLTTWGLGE